MKSDLEFIEDLYKMTIKELRVYGRKIGVYAPATLSKPDLIAQIRAIIYGTEMPVKTVSKKPLKDNEKQKYEANKKLFFDDISNCLPIQNDVESFDFPVQKVASPIVGFNESIDEQIKRIDLTGVKEEQIAIVCVSKKENFIYDSKTSTKYPISVKTVEKYQLSNGDFVYGDILAESEGFYDFDLKWLNGYWLKKEDLEHPFIKDDLFDLGGDNCGYSRLLTLFAPIIRGKTNLVACTTRDAEDKIIKDVCSDIRNNYKSTIVRACCFDIDEVDQREMSLILDNNVFVSNKLTNETVEDLSLFLNRCVQYYNADGEMVIVIRNIQELVHQFVSVYKDKDLVLEQLRTILGYSEKKVGKNAITVIATLCFDCDAAYPIYTSCVDCFASEFHMITIEKENDEKEVCDVLKCRTDNKLLSLKQQKFVMKQTNQAKELGLEIVFDNIVKLINTTKSNEALFN